MGKKIYLIMILVVSALTIDVKAETPIYGLLERIEKGASKKFVCELQSGDKDFFELDQRGSKVVVRGNSNVSIAVGINWYLKYYAGVHLSWNNMHAKLPAVLPSVPRMERHETDLRLRYYFNYCTFSYSMAFWDWERWQQEIDWMALHGINMPLAAVGNECVWRRVLLRLGYSEDEVGRFIAGPAFLAWWEMNNLEGWGGPLPLSWYAQQEALQKRILKRMRDFGITPVLPGYSGMCPSGMSGMKNEELRMKNDSSLFTLHSKKTLHSSLSESNQSSIQLWNGFTRPGVLMPGDPMFDRFAKLYYEEMRKMFGTSEYYSIDPFHEASNLPEDLNIGEAGKKILSAMKEYGNEHSTWVVQGWSENPRPEMLDSLPNGDVLVLDLFSECRPQFGLKNTIWYRPDGYGNHDWCFCMLENFGANIGLHGRMDQLLSNFYAARSSFSRHLRGIGLTMEGIETNPWMYELMCELPWRSEKVDKDEWLATFLRARYGILGMKNDSSLFTLHSSLKEDSSFFILHSSLSHGILNCPDGNNQQGPHESVFCSRPSLECFQASSWSKMMNYYDPNSTMTAARAMLDMADVLRGNDNFEYDLVDVCRQAIADRGRIVYNRMVADFKSYDRAAFKRHKAEFLDLILKQDSLLATRSEFRVGRWIGQARSLGKTEEEKNLYEWNARVQITTWGNRYCADTGGLRDYAHKEWNGILRDFYYPRWVHYLDILEQEIDGRLPVLPVGNSSWTKEGNPAVSIDWYALEEPWTLQHNHYPADGEGSAVDVCRMIIGELNSSDR